MITREVKHISQEANFNLLHPLLREWFKNKFGNFTEPQLYSIPLIHKKENVLISAETGTGKTLAAFTAILNELIYREEAGNLENKVYCMYISPLRALSRDIEINLKEPLKEIEEIAKKQGKKIDIPIAVRTGDTTPSERAKMLRKIPKILITTPESAAILLNSPKFKENLRTLPCG